MLNIILLLPYSFFYYKFIYIRKHKIFKYMYKRIQTIFLVLLFTSVSTIKIEASESLNNSNSDVHKTEFKTVEFILKEQERQQNLVSPQNVVVKKTNDGYMLEVDGKPFFINDCLRLNCRIEP